MKKGCVTAFVAAGDVFADIVGGGGPGGAPRVFALSGKELLAGRETPLANFFAGDTARRGGVRVAVKDLDADRRAGVLTGDGAGSGIRVSAYRGIDLVSRGTAAFEFDAFPGVNGGVLVGRARGWSSVIRTPGVVCRGAGTQFLICVFLDAPRGLPAAP